MDKELIINPNRRAATARDTLGGGMLGSVLGAGADRLIRGGTGRSGVGAAVGGLAGAAAGALNSKAKNEKSRADINNREVAHRVRKRYDERSSDRHLVRQTMLRQALAKGVKDNPEHQKHLGRVQERINRGSRKVLTEKTSGILDMFRRGREPVVGPTTMAAGGGVGEKMTPPKWKRTMKDMPAAIAGGAIGYGLGLGAAELTGKMMGHAPRGRLARAAPLMAGAVGFGSGLAQADLRARLSDRRQHAQRAHNAKLGSLAAPKVPKSKKNAPWTQADEEFWGELD